MAHAGLSQALLLAGLDLLCLINFTNQSLARNAETLEERPASSLHRRPFIRHKRHAPVITDRQQLFKEIKGYQKLDMVFALQEGSASSLHMSPLIRHKRQAMVFIDRAVERSSKIFPKYIRRKHKVISKRGQVGFLYKRVLCTCARHDVV